MITQTHRVSQRVAAVPPSGIRKFFDVIATMPDVISLGVGEPDFTTPTQIIEEGVRSLRQGRDGDVAMTAVDESVVDLVADDEQVMARRYIRDAAQRLLVQHGAGRIARIAHEQDLRARRHGGLELIRLEREAGRGRRRDEDRLAAVEQDRRQVGDV